MFKRVQKWREKNEIYQGKEAKRIKLRGGSEKRKRDEERTELK